MLMVFGLIMININQFKDFIVRPVLDDLQMYSESAMELMVFTAAAESRGCHYIKQVKGPALGVFQCEPSTHHDIWFNYIAYRIRLINIMALKFDAPRIPDPSKLIYDMRYAAAIARLHYSRVSEALPESGDIEGMWEYYKKYYNTSKGRAKRDKALESYEAFLKSS